MRRRSAWDRFWEKVDVGHPAGCWVWTSATNGRGYGLFEYNRDGRKTVQAHRHAWFLLIGPPDPDLTIDHLCRNTLCVNPDHMMEIPRGENTLRGWGITGANRRKTHCKNGHEFTEENTRTRHRQGRLPSRECWVCHRSYVTK